MHLRSSMISLSSLSTLITFFKIQLSKNVIDQKNQLTIKVLLANWWSPSPEMGGYTNTKNERSWEIEVYSALGVLP